MYLIMSITCYCPSAEPAIEEVVRKDSIVGHASKERNKNGTRMAMTTPNRDAMKDGDSFRKFIKRHKIGFSLDQVKEALSAAPTEFQQSPDNPWVKLKKEQEEREE